MRWTVLSCAVLAVGCIRDSRGERDRGSSGIFENVQTIKAPLKGRGRCDRLGGAAKRCEEAKYLAETYVRRLDVGKDVCLEGGFGDDVGGTVPPSCLARAAIVDTRTNEVLVEVRGAKPDSRWFQKEQNQYWFEEGALVDLYLADHGY